MGEAAKEAPKPKPKEKPRIHTLDELRGFAVFCMVFYHAFFSIGVFFKIPWGVTLVKFFEPAEPYFAGLFILISGISSQLSHSNLVRGVKLFFIAYAITLVTYFALGSHDMIRFGILHMLSICMMAYGIIGKFLNLIPMWVGFILNAVLFILFYNITTGSIGLPFLFSYKLPTEWYNTDFMYVFGCPSKTFSSSDYFPLLPWIFIFFAGAFLGKAAAANKFPKFMYKKRIPFFSWLGRHALLIYVLHQPVIWGICYAAEWIVGLFTHSR
ncbi:MAG: heparan-alpha-glucosaminide N-acetyltransferase domain-containing protein [Clostridia bacterium]|nr:heparan-alpha-glucosaminide N-acetyltransferase domain-containing protein [Clostridia bacterium]